MAEVEKLLALLQVPQLGAQKIGKLLAEVDFETFCGYDAAQLRQLGWQEKQIQRWFSPDERWIASACEWAKQADCHLISLFDEAYPFLLRQISTAPPLLFVQGCVESLSLPQIAMVGSRDYSHYGEYWAGQFAAELAQHGMAVTSGLAIGIDGFCHQRVVNEGGRTIAVLGSGLNRLYPVRHKRLAEQIIDTGGALVSEFAPDQPPLAEHFPRRNRIISGLSLGTLVVEATLNSGSLITARYALEQGREVFALPNAVRNPYSAGCHQLIKSGALLVDSVQDILDAVAFQYQPPLAVQPLSARPVLSIPTTPALPPLSEVQQQLLAHLMLSPISADDVAKACDMAIETALVELLGMELLGLIKTVEGGYVRQ